MYISKKNHAPSNEATLEFIKKYGFATLVCNNNNNIEATHIPLEIEIIEERLILTGHVAFGNPIKNAIENSSNALAIFREPHAYISSSWYDHINVPTWNYIAVHLSGCLKKLSGESLLKSINKMVDHYEGERQDRFKTSDMSEDMLSAHMNGLIGFEIEVEKVEASFKLSQNRNETDYTNIINQLLKSDNLLEREIANEMRKLRPE